MKRGRKKLLALLIFLTVIVAVTIWGVSYWRAPERRVERLLEEVRDWEARTSQGGGASGQQPSTFDKILPTKNQRMLDDIVDDLAGVGSPGAEPLIRALKDRSEWVRFAAAVSLGKIGDKRAIAPLIDLLEDNGDSRCVAAAYALFEISSEEAISVFSAFLKEHPEQEFVAQRTIVVLVLWDVSDKRGVTPLVVGLKDSDEGIRRTAADALGKIGDSRAINPLLVAMGDASGEVRAKAAEALGKIGDPKALVSLVAALKDVEEYVRAKAAEALGKIGDERAIKPLIIALADEHSDVHANAALALAAIGGLETVEPLIGILKDENEYESSGQDILVKVAETLGQIGDARAVEPLIALLPSPDVTPPAPIIVKGRRRSSRPPGPPGCHERYDGSPVHKSVIIALGRIGDQRAVNVLRALLEDEYPGIRRAVVEALKKIDKKAGDAHK